MQLVGISLPLKPISFFRKQYLSFAIFTREFI